MAAPVISLRLTLYSDETILEGIALWVLPNVEVLDAAPGALVAVDNALSWALNHTFTPNFPIT